MKNLVKLVVTVSILLTSYQVFAVTKNVSNTKHNMASWATHGGGFKSTNVSEVCVFCHTPHGAGDSPLWNKESKTRGNIPYDPNDPFSAPGITASFNSYSTHYMSNDPLNRLFLGDETLLCMSCHDGVSSMAILHNAPNSLNGAPITFVSDLSRIGDVANNPADIGNPAAFLGFPSSTLPSGLTAEAYYGAPNYGFMVLGANSGLAGNLADHPISINYDEVYGKAPSQFVLRSVIAPGIRFFGQSKDQMECSSCHDPHVDYNAETRYKPFLSYPNASSAMCFQCHIK